MLYRIHIKRFSAYEMIQVLLEDSFLISVSMKGLFRRGEEPLVWHGHLRPSNKPKLSDLCSNHSAIEAGCESHAFLRHLVNFLQSFALSFCSLL